ncbi:MAG: 2'-5' RNA ligase family protein, partial [Nocardioides sp.]|nr:2'-5' RNA ligase family protein [Nocardioides sp.]
AGVADAEDSEGCGLAELEALARGCRAAAAHAGAPPDGARFHPHLTLARLGRSRDVLRWVRVLDTYSGPPWPVDEVALVASHLRDGQGGRPRHEVLACFPLGDG